MKIIKKIATGFAFIIFFILITALTFAVSWWFQFWDGYPRGADSISHIFRANQILTFWPNFNWFHAWSGGSPHFFWYPVLTYLIVAGVKVVSGLSLEFILSFFGVFTVALSAFAVFLLIYAITKAYFLSFATSIIYIITPGSWASDFSMGTYSRGASVAFLGFSLVGCYLWLKSLDDGKNSKRLYFLTIILLFISFLSHYNGGPQAFIFVFTMILFSVKGFANKIKRILELFIPATLMTSIFTFPLILLKSPSTSFAAGHKVFNFSDMFLSLDALLYIVTKANIRGTAGELFRLSPLLIPFLVLILVCILLFRRVEIKNNDLIFRIFWAMMALSVLLLIYGTVYFPFLKHYGSGIFDPRMIVLFLPSLLAPMVGIALYILLRKRILLELAGVVVLALAILWFFIQFPYSGVPKVQEADKITQLPLPFLPGKYDFNFRFGTGNYSNIASPFNYHYPYVPQTRDYFAIGVVVPDYYTYLVLAGWRWDDNFEETNFLFDWWGVKEFAVMNSEEGVEIDPVAKFKKNPEKYELIGDNGAFSVFSFKDESPITSSTDAEAMLVLGSKTSKAYNIIFRILAQSNINSEYIIPVEGKEYIDDYALEELELFPAIFIFDYKYHDFEKSAKLLNEYVKNGGGLVIESSKEQEISLSKSSNLADPWPIDKVEKIDFGKNWFLSKTNNYQDILKNINLEKFSPAVFDNGPWGISYGSNTKDWAKIILEDNNKGVIVAGEYGKGRIVWSGMNLPYHIATYKNSEESKLTGKMIAWVLKKEDLILQRNPAYTYSQEPKSNSLYYETENEKVEFINPEKRRIELKEPRKGILFKEAFFPNWKASLNGKRVKIYKAGSGFMYVPILNSKKGDQIIFTFGKHPIQQLGELLTLVTVLALILYVRNWWVLKPFFQKIKTRIKGIQSIISNWWGKDEEGDL